MRIFFWLTFLLSSPIAGMEHDEEAKDKEKLTSKVAPVLRVADGLNADGSLVKNYQRGLRYATDYFGNYGPYYIYLLGPDSEQSVREIYRQRAVSRANPNSTVPVERQIEEFLKRPNVVAEIKAVLSGKAEGGLTWTQDPPVLYEDVTTNAKGREKDPIENTWGALHEYHHVFQMAHCDTKQERNSEKHINSWIAEGMATYSSAKFMENLGLVDFKDYMLQLRKSGANIGRPSINEFLAKTENWQLDNESYWDKGEAAQVYYMLGAWATAYLIHVQDVDEVTVLKNWYHDIPRIGKSAAFKKHMGLSLTDFYKKFDAFVRQSDDEVMKIFQQRVEKKGRTVVEQPGLKQDPFPKATPESQGIAGGAIGRLNQLVTGFVKAEEIVGAELLVIKNRRTVMHEVFGYDDRLGDQALVKNTIFSIRSMTKPLAGAAAQILIDEEILKLSDPVAKYLDSFDNQQSRGVTIEHLLTHRSGFPMKSAGTLWSNYSSYKDIRQVADYWGKYGPQLFTPGERYHYADANVDTLGALIEVANGKPTEIFIEQRLFKKLGMRDSIALLRDDDSRVRRVAAKHAGGRGRWRQYWSWKGAPYFSFPMFAQGFYSTPVDYARFLAMVMDGGVVNGQRLLSKAAIARMLTPVSKTTMPTGFAGLGSSYGQLMHLYDDGGEVIAFGHSGSDGTYAWAWPAQDLMVLYFTQSRGSITMNRMEAVIDSLLARPVLDQAKEKTGKQGK